MIRCEAKLVVRARDINDEFEDRYGRQIDIASLVYGDDYYNDCYKRLYIDEDSVNEAFQYTDYENEDEVNRAKCLEMLANMFPDVNVLLVDVSW